MKKYIICIMSLLLLLGLSAPVSADWETDDTGDTANNATVGDYDIVRGKVELFPDGPGLEEYVYICIEMTTSLPGMILASFDLDGNPATGSSLTMVDIIKTCEGGVKLRTPPSPGVDMMLYIELRDQLATASTAYGDGCTGSPGNCQERDTQCTGLCTQGSVCYTGGATCQPDDVDCWVRGAICTAAGDPCDLSGDFCSDMTTPCTSSSPCGVGKVKGEWYANPMGGGGGQAKDPVERGRIDMPLPPGPGEGNEVCFKLPWKRIVEKVEANSTGPNPADFALAEDPANVKWELSTWYNTSANDDLIGTSPTCVHVTDVLPNAAPLLDAQGTNGGLCHMFQGHFQGCMEIMADEGNYKDLSANFGACQAHHGNQGACEGDPLCSWDDPKCLACIPFSDTTFDGNVNAFDFGVLKYGWGRTQFPCGP